MQIPPAPGSHPIASLPFSQLTTEEPTSLYLGFGNDRFKHMQLALGPDIPRPSLEVNYYSVVA